MNETTVRICEIELKGFKNTQYGRIEMPSSSNKSFDTQTVDILGIYGQNGSGKTAVIEAMSIIQTLLMGESLSRDLVIYISKDSETCNITVKFIIQSNIKKTMIEYSVLFTKLLNTGYEITKETLSAAAWNGSKFENRKTLIEYALHSNGILFTPKYRFEDLVRNSDENRVNLIVAKKIAKKDHVSFIFGDEGREVFVSTNNSATEDYGYIVQSLYQYACINLFVISNAHTGMINLDYKLPFAFRLECGEMVAKGDLAIRLDQPSVIDKERFDIVKRLIDGMNVVLEAIIPGLTIGIYDFGEQLLEDGSSGHRVELVSKRGEITIPLKHESEGIIKIISVLNALVCVYNNPSMCLIIDELDSGIHEYLLGELLSVFEKGAKGQIIFTSHNLRALEMLNKSSILFSTANPTNRYIRLQNIKSNNNLRDMYFRSILLGGQKESIYTETDSTDIGRAFRRAGKTVQDGCKN